ncbi:MAG: vWA domain-containing protein [archaeon]
MRKAILFTMDSILAAMLLIGGLLLINEVSTFKHTTDQVTFYAEDIVLALQTVRLAELNDTFILAEITNGNITDENKSLLEQAGEYWALNKSDKASTLIATFLGNLTPENHGVNISFFETIQSPRTVVYNNSQLPVQERIVARRMISGIKQVQQNESLLGSTASAFVKRAKNKKTSSYAYFGGFIGQGNITTFIDTLPVDVNTSDITDVILEVAAGNATFTLSINGNACNSSNASAVFTPVQNTSQSKRWNLTHCKDFITMPRTNLSMVFQGNISQAYLAGGYFKVTYRTDQLQENYTFGLEQYSFPGISGLVNLYDAFIVPGELTNISIFLHYKTNYSTFLYIEDKLVYSAISNGSNVTQNETNVTLGMENLTVLYLDQLSNRTIPIRFSSFNTSFIPINGSSADIVLITDMSGSMNWNMISGSSGYNIPNCNDTWLENSSAKRSKVAACLDWEFVNYVMNASYNGTRVWLVTFSDDSEYSSDLTNVSQVLLNQSISTTYWTPTPSGGTCICCGLNRAYNLLSNPLYSNPTRKRSVVLMTDGIPAYCCGRYKSGSHWYCSTTSTGVNSVSVDNDCGGNMADCTGNQCNAPIANAIHSAQRLFDDLNVTVYAVGIGPLETCTNANYTLRMIANVSNGSYFISSNASVLKDIYKFIANRTVSVNLSAQSLVVSEGGLVPSVLYDDSVINLTYTPYVDQPQPNEISIVLQSSPFSGCNTTFTIPEGVRIISARVTSYSGEHWTRDVIINNITVYNLSVYGADFASLGDPYSISVPASLLNIGENNITLLTGDSSLLETGCSLNNTIIYLAMVNSSTPRSIVLPKAEGCNWTIEFEDGSFSQTLIPSNYSGANLCSYTNASISYDALDAYQMPIFDLLQQLDFDRNGRVLVNLDQFDLELVISLVQQVPYLWGPSLMQVDVWR